MAKIEDIAQRIIDLSGGAANIKKVVNCMTRVRINYVNDELVDKEGIRKIDGVLGTNQAETFQIIVGPGKSVKVREAINEKIGATSNTASDDEPEKKEGFLKALTSIFIPIIPAIIASGVATGINNVLQNQANNVAMATGRTAAQVISSWNLTQITGILSILGTATLGYLVIYTGIMSAVQFNANMILGGVIGAITISNGLENLGLSSGQGGVFGVILGVWLLSKVEKVLKKYIPNILAVVFVPFLSLLITGGVYLFVVMPFAGFLSDGICNGIMWLIENAGVPGGFIIAGIAPSLTTTGLQNGLIPVQIELIRATGTTPISPVQIMGNAGLVGSGLGILVLNWKSKKVRDIAKGVIPTTFLAVGEPVLYGLAIPSGYGFFTASFGAACAGAMIRFLDVRQVAIGGAGMSAVPLMADGKYFHYLFCYGIGVLVAFSATYVVGMIRLKQNKSVGGLLTEGEEIVAEGI